jgi:hypothetical protein
VLGIVKLAREIAPDHPPVAWIAGLIGALHPTLVYAATHVQVALLGATLLVWVLLWGYRTGRTARRLHALVTGGILAIVTLTDPILSLGGLGAMAAMGQGRKSAGAGLRAWLPLPLCMIVIASIGVSPWLLRSAWVHGEFVPVKSTFGYAFWQGNCNLSEGTDKVVRPSVDQVLSESAGTGLASLNRRIWAARHEAGYIDDIALSKQEVRGLAAMSEPERSRTLFRRAISELQNQPGRYWRLCMRRFRYFWLFDETNPKSRVVAYRVSQLGLTIAALLGLALTRPEVRWSLWPTVLTAVGISVFHTLTIVSARFHIPIEPLLAVWAAAGLTRWKDLSEASATPAHDIVRVGVVSRFRRGVVVESGSRLL